VYISLEEKVRRLKARSCLQINTLKFTWMTSSCGNSCEKTSLTPHQHGKFKGMSAMLSKSVSTVWIVLFEPVLIGVAVETAVSRTVCKPWLDAILLWIQIHRHPKPI